jgi:hypothetical protein
MVEKHSFRNVERGFERIRTCVTLCSVQNSENITVRARPQFEASLPLSWITVVVL